MKAQQSNHKGILPVSDTPLLKTKKPSGRPSIKTPELLDRIITEITNGSNLRRLCERADMPSRDAIHTWLIKDDIFADQYARACKIRREYRFEGLEDTIDGEVDVQRARLKVDTLKWQMSKEDPKKYGDKVDVTTNGESLPAPIFGGMSATSTDQPA